MSNEPMEWVIANRLNVHYVLVNSAKSPVSILKVFNGRVELLAAKLWPERLCEVKLGIGNLPEKEVRYPGFPPGSDEQVWIGEAPRFQFLADQFLRNIIDGYLLLFNSGSYMTRSLDQLPPAAIGQCKIQRHPRVVTG